MVDLEALRHKLRPVTTAALANPKDKKAAKALSDDLDKITLVSEKSTDQR